MANTGPNPGDVFDVRKIRRLVELMKEHDLGEIDLRQGEQRIQLRRGGTPAVVPAPAPVAAAPAPAPGAAPATPARADTDAGALYVKSPMVGTFYSAANPDAEPFVKIGDQVGPETVVCIVEAMKVFNEIPAEIAGRVVEVLVGNGDSIEFDQPLFKLAKK